MNSTIDNHIRQIMASCLSQLVLMEKNTQRRCLMPIMIRKSKKEWHFNQQNQPKKGKPALEGKNYTHETHESMFGWHLHDDKKKDALRGDAAEQVSAGATKGRVSSHALLTVLDDFTDRFEQAEGKDDQQDQI